MIRLRTLGPFDLRSDDDSRLESVIAQPKRCALLAYLALNQPSGPTSRARLLNLLWADSTDDRGRNALNQSLYVLRRALGANAIKSPNRDELEVDLRWVQCDAVDFEEALDRGEAEAALELYGGAFLEDLRLPESLEFERWLEAERARLRDRAVEGARYLASCREEDANLPEAIYWTRWAVRESPYDETLVVDLLRRLSSSGDGVGLSREWSGYVERLSSDLDLEPSEGARAAYGQAVASAGEAVRGFALAPQPESGTPDSATAGRAGGSVPRPVRRTRRRWAQAAVAVSVIGLLSALVVSREGPPGRAAALPHRIAVLPFAVEGTGSYDYLGGAMAELLGVKLAVDELLLTIAVPNVAAGEVRDRESLAKAAGRVGATEYVDGRVIQTGSTAQITATLASVAGGRVSHSLVTIEEESDLLAAVDLMARELLVGWTEPTGATRAWPAGLPTSSLPALKAFLAGERALEHGLHDEAIGHLQDALLADSSFALAQLRLSEAALWADEPDLVFASTRRAWELRDRLPWNLRLLADARHAVYHEHDSRKGVELMRRLVTADPGNVEAAYELADLLFHQVTLGHSASQTRDLLEQVLERDPHHLGALLHLARLYAWEGRIEALESTVERGLLLARDSRSKIELRGLLAFASGDAAARNRVLAEIRTLDDDSLLGVASVIVSFVEEPAYLAQLARVLMGEERSLRIRTLGVAWLASLEAVSGRLEAAHEILARYDALDPRFLRVVALSLEHASLVQSPGRLTRARDRLAGLPEQPRDSVRLTAQLGAFGDAVHTTNLLALADLRLGDAASFAERLERAEALEKELPAYPDKTQSVLVLEAAAALEAEIPSEALRRLDLDEAGLGWNSGELYVLLRAEALADLGRGEDALRWYDVLPGDYQFGFVTAPARRLHRAELLDGLGRSDEAAEQYERFLYLFGAADSEFQPLVRRARGRLQELEADSQT